MISLTFKSKNDQKIPKVQSHRGFWNEHVKENTLNSIINSYENGFLMTEFDVRLTSDCQVILFHDPKIKGYPIARMNLNEIRNITQVDLLDDVFKWLKNIFASGDQFFLNIEIKSNSLFNRKLERKIIELVNHYGVQDKIIISSFNPFTLYYLKRQMPSVTRSLLLTLDKKQFGNTLLIRSMLLNILARPHYLHLDHENWSHWYIQKFLKGRVNIVLWTCNEIDRAQKYLNEGAVGLISDVIKPTDLENY